MTRYQPSPLQQVELVDDGGDWSLVFTREFPHSRAVVWSALTDPEELREWAPYTADRALDKPGPVTLFMADGTQQIELPGEVVTAEQPELLEFSWGGDLLRWELAEQRGATVLRLTHHVRERGQAAMMAAGWHICLDVADKLLADSPIGPIVGTEALNHGWSELNEQYSARLGVDVVEPPLN